MISPLRADPWLGTNKDPELGKVAESSSVVLRESTSAYCVPNYKTLNRMDL